MTDTSFRRLPVDLYDEDRVLVTDLYTPDARDPTQILNDTQHTHTQVKQSVQRGDTIGGLKLALQQPPYDGGEQPANSQINQAKVTKGGLLYKGRTCSLTRMSSYRPSI